MSPSRQLPAFRCAVAGEIVTVYSSLSKCSGTDALTSPWFAHVREVSAELLITFVLERRLDDTYS